MYVYLIFLFLIHKINSIQGTDQESYSQENDNSYKVDLDEFCPCDKNQGICDPKCCCDPDCLEDMLNQDYYENNPECDPLSSLSKRVDSKLDYCEGHQKAVEDLYNPLVLAFKILKKGFCLAKKNPKKKDEPIDYKKLIEDYQKEEKETKEDQENIFNKVLPNGESFNTNVKEIKEFEAININAPISLPNGLCLFKAYPIKKFMDYEVECSYFGNQRDQIRQIMNPFRSTNSIFYLINNNNNYRRVLENEILNDFYIKKVEIIYYEEENTYYTRFYYINQNYDNYVDFIYIFKFLYNETDYINSGSPGYIKGKPILIGEKSDTENIIKKYENDAVFPIDSDSISIQENNDNVFIYYDNYFDNKITFEDLTIYGYRTDVSNNKNELASLFNREAIKYRIGKYGNANISYNYDWLEMNPFNNINNPYLIIGEYKDIGAVNNTQFTIVNFQKNENKTLDIVNYRYLIIKFLRQKTKRGWWYAPGPGFIKLPQNIMYPFRIGTTKYVKR